MKDFLGNELKVGQWVVFSGLEGASLDKGFVDSFTPKMVRITQVGRGARTWVVLKHPDNIVGIHD